MKLVKYIDSGEFEGLYQLGYYKVGGQPEYPMYSNERAAHEFLKAFLETMCIKPKGVWHLNQLLEGCEFEEAEGLLFIESLDISPPSSTSKDPIEYGGRTILTYEKLGETINSLNIER